MVKVPEYIHSLIPYKAGKTLEDINRLSFAKLASNENPLGCSPKALAAMTENLHQGHLYPDPSATALIQKLAEHHGVKPENLACANGSDALLEYAVMTFSAAGDEILTSEGTFIGIYVVIKKLGRQAVLTPLHEWSYDLTRMLSMITPKTKVIYVANPNNPTGTHISKQALQNFLAEVPKDILVILDEAYYEYASSSADYPDGSKLSQENLLVLRTFSKSYGLAGLRVGYAIGDKEVVSALRKVKLPFEPSRIAQVAALHAIEDRDFLAKTLATNKISKEILREELEASGYTFVESIANFFMIYFDRAETAKRFHDVCTEKGLYLRHLAGFGLPRCVRINSGTKEQSIFAANILNEAARLIP